MTDYPIQYVNGKVWVNNHAHVVQGITNIIVNKFLLFSLKQVNIEPFLVGGGRAKLNAEIMMKLPIFLTTYDEQQSIASFFSTLDHLITLQQCEHHFHNSNAKSSFSEIISHHIEEIAAIIFHFPTNTWEQRKLGEIGEVAMNRRIFKDQTTESGEIPFYKIGTFGSEPDSFISRSLFEEYKEKYPYPKVGDLLISASGSIGRVVEYMGEEAYFQDSNIVWLNHNNNIVNSFLKQFYNIVKWYGIEGTTIKRLYNKNILNTEISLPCFQEQEAIGSFFSTLDHLITLQQCKPLMFISLALKAIS